MTFSVFTRLDVRPRCDRYRQSRDSPDTDSSSGGNRLRRQRPGVSTAADHGLTPKRTPTTGTEWTTRSQRGSGCGDHPPCLPLSLARQSKRTDCGDPRTGDHGTAFRCPGRTAPRPAATAIASSAYRQQRWRRPAKRIHRDAGREPTPINGDRPAAAKRPSVPRRRSLTPRKPGSRRDG